MLFKLRLEGLAMTADKQTQKAGENSQLMQAGTINIYNNGIDEKEPEKFVQRHTLLLVEILQPMHMHMLMSECRNLKIHYYLRCNKLKEHLVRLPIHHFNFY